jgi:predicted alpha/beta superfamily hydrolase
MRTFYCLISFVIIQLQGFSQIPVISSGTIRHYENFSSKYVTARNVDVWLPDGFSSQKKYSVLYMHDGQMLFDTTNNWNKQEWGVDETFGKLLKENKIRDCIVVGIWNTQFRHPEYFPQKAQEYLTECQINDLMQSTRTEGAPPLLGEGPISDDYLQFLVTELKPFIDKTYPTLPTPENTFIAGSSMGGLISMYAICEYPDVFGGAACLSTHWPGTFSLENNPVPGAFLEYLSDHLPSPENHKFYFDFGTETLDAWYEPFQLQVDEIMKSKGYTSENWITKKFPGENHSEKAWKKRLEIPMAFLLGNKN